jgi:ELWxxDGT repeat protein
MSIDGNVRKSLDGSRSPAGRNLLPALLFLAVLTGWVSPSVAQYAVPVTDLWPVISSSLPDHLTAHGNQLFFVANGRVNGSARGRELWKSDGTEEGTDLVGDIRSGPLGSFPGDLTVVGQTLFFVADGGTTGRELWKSDGTEEGTDLVMDIWPGPEGSKPSELTSVGSVLFFAADDGENGSELWASNGTTFGTVLVMDIWPGPEGSKPSELTSVGSVLFFAADDEEHGSELWTSNGTTGETYLIGDIRPGFEGSSPRNFVNVGGTLFFTANDSIVGDELWKRNDALDVTALVKDIRPGPESSGLIHLTAVNGSLFFTALGDTTDNELWKSDGTTSGTVVVKDIFPGPGGSKPSHLTAVGEKLFFVANDGVAGRELWKSDGTLHGTVLLKDIRPGVQSSAASELTAAGETLFFLANDGITGKELWMSDGTSDGTFRVRDIRFGSATSGARYLTAAGETVFFAADDGGTGEELWRTVPAPVITVETPRLDFPPVTLGDWGQATLLIENRGRVPLTIEDVRLPSSALRHDHEVPWDVPPGERSVITFFLESRVPLDASGEIQLMTNDPHRPETAVHVVGRVVDLEIEPPVLVPTAEEVPLGESVTVLVLPAPDVRIEEGFLFHRAAGAAAFDSIRLVEHPFGKDWQATIPEADVTELGIDYYVKVKNSGFEVTHPLTAPDSVIRQNVQPPGAIVTRPQPTQETGFLEGREIRVLVEIPKGSRFDAGTLKYRRGGETRYDSVAVVAAEPLAAGVIPLEHVGSRGVEYWVDVCTQTQRLTDPAKNPAGRPHSISITVGNVIETNRHAGETYRLLSIPLSMGGILGSLTDDVGGPDKTRWRMFTYLPGADRYAKVPDEDAGLTTFERGRAYWLITREAHRIDTGPDQGETTPTDRPFGITLQPGYNLIGNPFNFAVAWDSCFVDALSMSDAVADLLVEWPVAHVPGEGYDSTDVAILEPFSGYWVKNTAKSKLPVTLRVPAVEAPPSALVEQKRGVALPARAAGAPQGWRIRIRAACGLEGASAVAGKEKTASVTRDSHDRSMPPMPPEWSLAVHFPHDDWRDQPGSYVRDIRGQYECPDGGDVWGHMWRFDVAKSFSDETAGDVVSLEIFGIHDLSEDALVYLADTHLQRVVDLRAESRYTFYQGERKFVTSDQDARFVLLVGSVEFVTRQSSEMARIPSKTILHQNVPNPFNPSTIIRYELAVPGRVSLRIYDVHGALVRVLEDRGRTPGRYEVGWDGRDERGERVATGVYFYRLMVPDFEQTKKLVLIK